MGGARMAIRLLPSPWRGRFEGMAMDMARRSIGGSQAEVVYVLVARLVAEGWIRFCQAA